LAHLRKFLRNIFVLKGIHHTFGAGSSFLEAKDASKFPTKQGIDNPTDCTIRAIRKQE
jgi:hypothetical protein